MSPKSLIYTSYYQYLRDLRFFKTVFLDLSGAAVTPSLTQN